MCVRGKGREIDRERGEREREKEIKRERQRERDRQTERHKGKGREGNTTYPEDLKVLSDSCCCLCIGTPVAGSGLNTVH